MKTIALFPLFLFFNSIVCSASCFCEQMKESSGNARYICLAEPIQMQPGFTKESGASVFYNAYAPSYSMATLYPQRKGVSPTARGAIVGLISGVLVGAVAMGIWESYGGFIDISPVYPIMGAAGGAFIGAAIGIMAEPVRKPTNRIYHAR